MGDKNITLIEIHSGVCYFLRGETKRAVRAYSTGTWHPAHKARIERLNRMLKTYSGKMDAKVNAQGEPYLFLRP